MKNQKIRVKLLLGFLIVSVLALIVGLGGIYGLVRTSKDMQELNRLGTVGLEAAKLAENLADQRSAFRGGALKEANGDKSGAQKEFADIEKLDSDFKNTYAMLNETLTTKEAKEKMLIMDGQYGEYRRNAETVLKALMDQTKSNEEHYRAITTLEVSFNSIDKTVNELTALIDRIQDDQTWNSNRDTRMIMIILAVVIIVAIGAAIVLGIFLASRISKPVISLVEAAKRLSAGETEIKLDIHQADELGMLADAFTEMAQGIRLQAESLMGIAEGDYRIHINERSHDDLMNKSVNTLIEKSNGTLLTIRDAAAQVSASAGQIAMGAQNLASGSTEQAASLQEFSAAIAELLKESEENAEKSHEALERVKTARDFTEASMVSMEQMTKAMRAINESSDSIARVIKVIDDIAFQTNILALNAAVEAARAGVHGKGFAVVADEVRNLASKSAEAARETAALIESSTQKVTEGNAIVIKTGENMGQVSKISETISDSMREINDSSGEQRRAISDIMASINQISQVVQSNSATAEESAAAAEELSAQSLMLEDEVSRFRLRERGERIDGDDQRASSSGTVREIDLKNSKY